MTVKTGYTGNGTLKDYEVGFPFLADAHLRVFNNGVLMVQGTHFNLVTPLQQSSGQGAKKIISFGTAPTNGHAIKIARNTPFAAVTLDPAMGHSHFLQTLFKQQEMQGKSFGRLVQQHLQTALLAGTAVSIEAPCDGYIDSLESLVTKAVTTGGDFSVEIDGTAVTGLAITIGDGAIVGAQQVDAPTTPLSTTTKFKAGSLITVTPTSAFATAGEIVTALNCTPADL